MRKVSNIELYISRKCCGTKLSWGSLRQCFGNKMDNAWATCLCIHDECVQANPTPSWVMLSPFLSSFVTAAMPSIKFECFFMSEFLWLLPFMMINGAMLCCVPPKKKEEKYIKERPKNPGHGWVATRKLFSRGKILHAYYDCNSLFPLNNDNESTFLNGPQNGCHFALFYCAGWIRDLHNLWGSKCQRADHQRKKNVLASH